MSQHQIQKYLAHLRLKTKISPLTLREEFLDKIANKDKNMNHEIFKTYIGYQILSFLLEDFYKVNQDKNNLISISIQLTMQEIHGLKT